MTDIIEIFGNQTLDPIPLGVRIGHVIHLSRITGRDQETGSPAPSVEQQLTLAFQAMREAVESAGGAIENIAQVSFFLANFDDRPLINEPWTAMFPNEYDRPTYKFMQAPLPDGVLVQLELWAIVGERREVINPPGPFHSNPIPMGVRMGTHVFSSRILPFEADTNQPARDLERQAELVFINLQAFLHAARINREEISQARLFISDRECLPVAQRHWDAFFAGTSERPAVRTVLYPQTPAARIYLEIIGKADEGRD
jgi:2-iminobutanoate/2-iminopropanoate deaminase